MSFERLKQALEREANARLAAVKGRQRQQLAAESARIKRAARELEEHIIRQAEAEAEQRVKRLHQEHKLAAKARVLAAKQAELAATQAAVIERLMSQEVQETDALLRALIELLPKEANLPDEQRGRIIAGADHRDRLKKLLPKQYTISDQTVPGGGFIYRGTTSELNLTIDVLVRQLFKRHRAAIAQQLFS